MVSVLSQSLTPAMTINVYEWRPFKLSILLPSNRKAFLILRNTSRKSVNSRWSKLDLSTDLIRSLRREAVGDDSSKPDESQGKVSK